MTRELKLALLVGFFLVLLVSFLIADHLSASRRASLDEKIAQQQPATSQGSPNAMLREPAIDDRPEPMVSFTQGAGGRMRMGEETLDPKPVNADATLMAEMGQRVGEVLNGEAQLPPAINTGALPLSDLTSLTMSQNQVPGMDTLGAKGAAQPRDSVEQALRDSQVAKIVGAGAPSGAPQARATGSDATVRPFGSPVTIQRDFGGATNAAPVIASPVPQQAQAVVQAGAKPAAPQEPKGEEDRWHTIASGDTAMKIAKRYYGDSSVWRELAKYNGDRMGKNGELRVGVRVKIPAPEKLGLKAGAIAQAGKAQGAQGASEVPVKAEPKKVEPKKADSNKDEARPRNAITPAQAGRTYIVKKGDTMSEIAMNELGTMKRADEIVKLNSLKDAGSIRVGMTLKLPAK